MTRLILITVIGVVVLVLLFEVTRVPEAQSDGSLYYEIVSELLKAQPPKEGWDWHMSPLPVSGTQAKEGDYISLTPREIEWSRGTGSEGRRLPEPPPPPATPPRQVSRSLKPVLVTEGNVQTRWLLLRKKGIEDHKLVEAFAGGRLVTKKEAGLERVLGREPELRLYECYLLPFKVYRYRHVIQVQPSSRYPTGKRLAEVGMPWVEWGEPFLQSTTTCWTYFAAKSAKLKDMVPEDDRFELPVVRSGR